MWYVGIDVHLRRSSVCVLAENGQQIQQTTLIGPWIRVVEWLKRLAGLLAICFEASCGEALFNCAHIDRRYLVV